MGAVVVGRWVGRLLVRWLGNFGLSQLTYFSTIFNLLPETWQQKRKNHKARWCGVVRYEMFEKLLVHLK